MPSTSFGSVRPYCYHGCYQEGCPTPLESGTMEAVLVLVGVIIGGAVTITTNVLQHRAEADLDANKRRDDRRIEHERAERETLYALQDATAAMVIDARRYRVARDGGSPNLDDLATAYAQRGLQIKSLASRVSDDTIPRLASEFLNLTAEAREQVASIDKAGELIDKAGESARLTFPTTLRRPSAYERVTRALRGQ